MRKISEFVRTIAGDDDYAEERIRYFDDSNPDDIEHLGLKGWNLCMLTGLKVPVPPGFILSSKVCGDFYDDISEGTPLAIEQSKYVHITKCCMTGIEQIEIKANKRFGATRDSPSLPLVLSVRPSPPFISSGLIKSVMNLGLNEDIVERLSDMPGGSEHFALEVYCRFLRDFGTMVMDADRLLYDAVRDGLKKNEGVNHTHQLSTRALRMMINTYRTIATPPDDPYEQLQLAIESMYMAYASESCAKFRAAHDIEGTHLAICIQEMVFGNMNDRSGSGVCYCGHSDLGDVLMGDYLAEAVGKSVHDDHYHPQDVNTLQEKFPDAFRTLTRAFGALKDKSDQKLQFLEFTIQNGRCYILETDAVKSKPPSRKTRFLARMTSSFYAHK